MAIATVNNQNLPFTGPFGVGISRTYGTAGTYNFVVPDGIANVRVRIWGGGSGGVSSGRGATGGGFAFKTIYGLTSGATIVVTVGIGGAASSSGGGTSSFGSFCSATGGTYNSSTPGIGSGGDINTSGGISTNANGSGGGGCGNLYGDGGAGSPGASANGRDGASGGGGGSATPYLGGNGFVGIGANYISATSIFPATSGNSGVYSLDFIGTGGGGTYNFPGINGGGGGGSAATGGFPGGGGGTGGNGGSGLVIVEY